MVHEASGGFLDVLPATAMSTCERAVARPPQGSILGARVHDKHGLYALIRVSCRWDAQDSAGLCRRRIKPVQLGREDGTRDLGALSAPLEEKGNGRWRKEEGPTPRHQCWMRREPVVRKTPALCVQGNAGEHPLSGLASMHGCRASLIEHAFRNEAKSELAMAAVIRCDRWDAWHPPVTWRLSHGLNHAVLLRKERARCYEPKHLCWRIWLTGDGVYTTWCG